MSAIGDEGEQSRQERLEIARRYRERRGRELRELASERIDGEILVAGEFSTVPTEAIAAIPGLGMLLLPLARRRSRKVGLAPQILLAIQPETVHALGIDPAGLRRNTAEVALARSWPRSAVTAETAGKAFMRDKVLLHVPDADEPLSLYAPPLRTNPWSAEVVRMLGGEAPEPLDLEDPPSSSP